MAHPVFSRTSNEAIKIAKEIVKAAEANELTDDVYADIELSLQRTNVNVRIAHFKNDTLMHLAVRMKTDRLFAMLLKANGDVSITNDDNESVIELATRLNCEEILKQIGETLAAIEMGVVRIENIESEDFFASFRSEIKLEREKCKHLKVIRIDKVNDFFTASAINENFCDIFPNLFAIQVYQFDVNDSELVCDISRYFHDKRPMLVQFMQSSTYHFRQEGTEEFVGENAEGFELVCKLIHGTDEAIDIREDIIKKNDTFAMRFLKLFRVTQAHRLVFDSIEFGSLAMVKASLSLPWDEKREHFIHKIAKLMTSVHTNDQSVLKHAIECDKIDVVEFFIENFKSILFLLPFSQRKSISDLVAEKDLSNTFVKLLNIDFPFPDLHKINNFTKEITDVMNQREKLKSATVDDIESFVDTLRQDQNSFIRFAFDKSNKSVLLNALESKKLDVYSSLRALGFYFDEKESGDICGLLKGLTEDEKRKLRIENAYNAIDDGENHIRTLINKFSLFGLYDNQAKQKESFEMVSRCLVDLNKIPEISKLLTFCAEIEKMKVTIAPENELLFDVDPMSLDCYGSATSDGLVFVAAGERDERKVKETIIHESCHVAIVEYFENDFKPYFEFDERRAEEFQTTVEHVRKFVEEKNDDDGCGGIISSVFNAYEEDKFECELIVRALSILAFYGNENDEKVNQLRKDYKELFDFSQKSVTDVISIACVKERKQVRSLNKYLRLTQDIDPRVTPLKLSKNKKRTQKLKKVLKSSKHHLITSNTPVLVLVDLQDYLNESQSALFDTRNIFVKPESLENDKIFEDFRKVLENHSDRDEDLKESPFLDHPINFIVDLSNNTKVRAINGQVKTVFVASSANEERMKELLRDNEIQFEHKSVIYCWNDLSYLAQANMLRTEAEFQGRLVQLSHVINDEIMMNESLADLFIDLCNGSKVSINVMKKFPENYYVERSFVKAIEDNILDISQFPPKQIKQTQQIETAFDQATQNIEVKIHFKNEPVYNLDQVVKMCENERIVLLSDIGGSGKSFALKKIFNHFYDTSDEWTIFLDLREYLEEFEMIKDRKEKKNFLNFFHAFLAKSLKSHEIAIFEDFYKNGNVKIIMDGFDEISPRCKEVVLEVIKSVRQAKPQNQLWVSTRKHLENDLQKIIDAKAIFSLNPLNTEEQKAFLVKFWTFNKIQNASMDQIASDLVTKISSFSSQRGNLIGIMQQLRIMAKIWMHKGDIRPQRIDSLTMYDIYDRSVDNYIELWQSSPLGKVEDRKTHRGLERIPNFQTVHQFYALKEFLLPKVIEKLFKDEGKMWDLENVARGGLITYYKGTKKAIFIHATYAEYFVANYLLQTLHHDIGWKHFELFAGIFIDSLFNAKSQTILMFINDKINEIDISEDKIKYFARLVATRQQILLNAIFNGSQNTIDFLERVFVFLGKEEKKAQLNLALVLCMFKAQNDQTFHKIFDMFKAVFDDKEFIEILKTKAVDEMPIGYSFSNSMVTLEVLKTLIDEIVVRSKGNREDVKHILLGRMKADQIVENIPLYLWIPRISDESIEKLEYLWSLHEKYLSEEEMKEYVYNNVLMAMSKGSSVKIFNFLYEKIKSRSDLKFAKMLDDHLLEFASNIRLDIHKTLWKYMEAESEAENLSLKKLMLKMYKNYSESRNFLLHFVLVNDSEEILRFTFAKIVENLKTDSEEIFSSRCGNHMNLLHVSLFLPKGINFTETLFALLREHCGNQLFKSLLCADISENQNIYDIAISRSSIFIFDLIMRNLNILGVPLEEFRFLLAKWNGDEWVNFLACATLFNQSLDVHKYLWSVAKMHFTNIISLLIDWPDTTLLLTAVSCSTIEINDYIWSEIKLFLKEKAEQKKYLLRNDFRGKSLHEIAVTENRFGASSWVEKTYTEYGIKIPKFKYAKNVNNPVNN